MADSSEVGDETSFPFCYDIYAFFKNALQYSLYKFTNLININIIILKTCG